MQYSVPQFVDVEDKVIGPLTIRQFLWLLAGAGIALVVWLLLPTIVAIILTIPVAGLAGTFAFYKVNGMTFNIYITNLFSFAVKPKERVWKRAVAMDVKVIPETKKATKEKKYKVGLNDVSLNELVGILDNELSPQARSKPVSNPIEPAPVVQTMPVSYSLNSPEYQNIPVDTQMQAAPLNQNVVPLSPQAIPQTTPIKSIKPFRR